MKKNLLFVFFLLTLSIPALAARQDQTALLLTPEVRQADTIPPLDSILAASVAFSQAYVRGDSVFMAQSYTEDGVIFPSRRDLIRGRAAIQSYWKLPEGVEILEHKSTPVEITLVGGNTAYDYGYFEGKSRRNGEEQAFKCKYVIVWERGRDGVWRMKLDIWNPL